MHVAKFASLSLVVLAMTGISGCQTIKNTKLFGGKEEIKATTASKSEQGYYTEASNQIAKGNFSRAAASLTDLRTFYPTGVYSEQALLDLMYAQFQSGDYLEAVASAERFIQSYPTNPQVSYAHYVRGVANMQAGNGGIMKYTRLNPAHRDLGYSRLAFSNFQELIARYPNSPYAPDAALRMQYIYNQLAESELDTARWYIKRKAYVAAANRAKWVFQYYPQSEAIPEAIATMAYAYGKLGMNDTKQQYLNLLKINYPELLDSTGDVRLDGTRTTANWLNKITLGALGRSSQTAKVSQSSNPTSSTATKPQVIVTQQQLAQMAQASQLRLPPAQQPNQDDIAEGIDAPRRVNIGLDLPNEVTNQPSGISSTTDVTNESMQQLNQPLQSQ